MARRMEGMAAQDWHPFIQGWLHCLASTALTVTFVGFHWLQHLLQVPEAKQGWAESPETSFSLRQVLCSTSSASWTFLALFATRVKIGTSGNPML